MSQDAHQLANIEDNTPNYRGVYHCGGEPSAGRSVD